MPLASLYRICIDNVCGLLLGKKWKFIPFASLRIPTSIVNDLMQFIVTHSDGNPVILSDITPLIITGQLQYFNLLPFNLHIQHNDIMSLLYDSEDPKTLETLRQIEDIILLNPNLEELHLNMRPDLGILLNCPKLRILRLYPPLHCSRKDEYYNLTLDFSVLFELRNLEELYIPYINTDNMVDVLDRCPKLISLGAIDSLDAMKEMFVSLHDESLAKCDRPNFDRGHFQLKRCVWGWENELAIGETYGLQVYRSEFTSKMKFAVTFCPLVEELVIRVYDKDALRLLKVLEKLILLRIDFRVCKCEFLPELIELLQEIGPQLKHLSILSYHPIPFDAIFSCCPLLQSLEISGPMFFNYSSKICNDFPLKRFQFSLPDKDSFMFLVSNCKHLEEMFLETAEFLDDDFLQEIFQINPLTELKVLYISDCFLTNSACIKILDLVPSINIIEIDSKFRFMYYDVDFPNYDQILHYKKYFGVRKEEFFYRQLQINRF